jgi:hypothetical protein
MQLQVEVSRELEEETRRLCSSLPAEPEELLQEAIQELEGTVAYVMRKLARQHRLRMAEERRRAEEEHHG